MIKYISRALKNTVIECFNIIEILKMCLFLLCIFVMMDNAIGIIGAMCTGIFIMFIVVTIFVMCLIELYIKKGWK